MYQTSLRYIMSSYMYPETDHKAWQKNYFEEVPTNWMNNPVILLLTLNFIISAW